MNINWKNIQNIKDNLNEKKEEKKIDDNNCKSCKKNTVVYDSEYFVCMNCGVVNGLFISSSQEWSYYGINDNKRVDPTRCGAPTNSFTQNPSLSTTIAGYGNSKLKSLHKRHAITYKERSIINIFKKTENNIRDKNISIYELELAEKYYTLLGHKSKDRITKDNFMAACIFYTCRDKNNIKTYIEIANIFNIKSKNMTKGINIFHELIYWYYPSLLIKIQPLNCFDFINRYCLELKISDNIKLKIINIAKCVKTLGLNFKNTPISVAIGCIYVAIVEYKLNLTKNDLHKKTSISIVTITNSYNKFSKYKKYLL